MRVLQALLVRDGVGVGRETEQAVGQRQSLEMRECFSQIQTP